MIETIQLQEGITLRCCNDDRFKTSCLSLQIVRPMCRQEAAANALISAVLLRGSRRYPDLRDITLRLDDLYGASVGSLVRQVSDYQTTGFYCSFAQERYAMAGDAILEPMLDFVKELLLHPRMENGGFCADYVEGEKRNLLSAVEAQKNDKRAYAAAQLNKYMCAADPSGVPRLGEPEQIRKLEPVSLYSHYRRILKQSRIDLFYVGDCPARRLAELLSDLFGDMERDYQPLPEQTPFCDGGDTRHEETMDVTQAKLQMGFVTPCTLHSEDYVAMRVFNAMFGGDMINKLFMNVREKMSLCYDIGSSYMGGKGILTVGAGMDNAMAQTVEDEIRNQLEQCRQGNITPQELEAAQQSLLSSLKGLYDSPGSIENYYAVAALSGQTITLEQYRQKVSQVNVEKLQELACKLRLHSVFLLKGVQ